MIRAPALAGLLACALLPGPGSVATGTGATVRVTLLERTATDPLAARPGDRLVGTLVGADARRLLLVRRGSPGDTLAIPRESVAAFETSGGRHARTGTGARIGLLAGTAAGVGIGIYLEKSEHLSRSGFPAAGFLPVTLGVGGAFGGLGLGALVGSLVHAERWDPAELPAGP